MHLNPLEPEQRLANTDQQVLQISNSPNLGFEYNSDNNVLKQQRTQDSPAAPSD
jgi:hypothetical protein